MLPKHLNFIVNRLYCNKNIHSESEKRYIANYRNSLLKIYKLKVKVNYQILNN